MWNLKEAVLRAHWTVLNNFGCSENFRVGYLWLCKLKKISFVIQDVWSRMCWQKFSLFSLDQNCVFMTISRRTVLRINWNVGKCFGCSEKFRIIIYDYVGKQNSSHFIQGIPPALCWQKSVCSYWCRNEFLSPYDPSVFHFLLNFRRTILPTHTCISSSFGCLKRSELIICHYVDQNACCTAQMCWQKSVDNFYPKWKFETVWFSMS